MSSETEQHEHSEPAGASAADERIPCPDDACVGILDERGVCGTCGRVDPAGRTGAVARAAERGEVDEADATGAGEPAAGGAEARELGETSAGEGDERVPCFDDACTGIIGPDGACGTCHRRPPGQSPASS